MKRHFLPASVALAFVAVGCASEPSASESNGAEANLTRSTLDAAAIVDRAQCAAGNSSHSVETYDPATFDAAAALAKMKADDADYGCSGRIYSTSRDDGVATFKNFVTGQAEWITASCEDEEDPQRVPKLNEDLVALVSDPTNLGVFSTVHDENGPDDAVSCYFWRFHVYRADGKFVSFNFDWSD